MKAGTKIWVRRIVREPLAQFLAIGFMLFLVNGLINGPDSEMVEDTVIVTQGRVQQIAQSYQLISGRLPSRAELEALVDDYIEEEVAYREAMAMGLDTDDTIIRRRLRQKLTFLIEDVAATDDPSEEELAQWLMTHPEDYYLPPRVSFRHVLASTDQRGNRAKADAATFIDQLSQGAEVEGLGDSSMLPKALPLTTQQGTASLFGTRFAQDVFAHDGQEWFGPVISPFGAHAVLILSREPGRTPSLDDVRAQVRADWVEAKRTAGRQKYQARLRDLYKVTIDWPTPYAGSSGSADVAAIEQTDVDRP